MAQGKRGNVWSCQDVISPVRFEELIRVAFKVPVRQTLSILSGTSIGVILVVLTFDHRLVASMSDGVGDRFSKVQNEIFKRASGHKRFPRRASAIGML